MADGERSSGEALAAQLRRWRALLAEGHERVGWKLGIGDRERIGDGPELGHITSATTLRDGAAYRAGAGAALHADAEVAIQLAHDVRPDASVQAARSAIGAYGAAIELVDLGPVAGGAEAIVATNIFHRAVAFGRLGRDVLPGPVDARLIVSGELRASGSASADYGALVQRGAKLLGEVGEQLRAGDRLITGSVVQVPVGVGDDVMVDLGELGRVELSVV